jgi:hypothetical protein
MAPTEEKLILLNRLAQGNPVDLEQLAAVLRQLAELQRAGAIRQESEAVTSPLAKAIAAGAAGRRKITIANAADMARPYSEKIA